MNETPVANPADLPLSAAVVIGRCRHRAQRCLEALAAQQDAADIELIIVDLTTAGVPPLPLPPPGTCASVRYLRPPLPLRMSEARALAVREARGDVIAFIEDHCFPAPDWSAAIRTAFTEGDWAAVGYAFTCDNPRTYTSRACMTADYGMFTHPCPRGTRTHLPGNNVAYRTGELRALGARLEALLSPDFVIQDYFRRQGRPLFLESRAMAAHQNPERLGPMLAANHHYCRLLADRRATTQEWTPLRRVFYGLAALPAAPVIKLIRMVRQCGNDPEKRARLAASLPVVAITFAVSAVGESLGYLLGAGDAGRHFDWYELDAERVMHTE